LTYIKSVVRRKKATTFGGRFMLVFKLAALVELSLVILENSGSLYLRRRLPLGGGPIQQLGLVFATAYVIAELIGLLN
jgi:hypothetical protein